MLNCAERSMACMKRDRVVIRSSSRPDEMGKEQYVEVNDDHIIVTSSSRSYRNEDESGKRKQAI